MSLRSGLLALLLLAVACSGSSGSPATGGPPKSGAAGSGGAGKPPADGGNGKAAAKSGTPLAEWTWLRADISADEFGVSCRGGLEEAREILPTLLEAKGERTEADLLSPFNKLAMAIERSGAPASLMSAVHPVEVVRKAAEECEQAVTKFTSELSRNKELYAAFAAIDGSQLEPNAQRLVARMLRDFRREGVDKDDATRARLEAIDKKLVELGQKFAKKLADDVGHIELKSEKDLAGLPEDYIKAHRPEAGKPIRITTANPDYLPFMSYAQSTKHRKALYIVNRTRGGIENEKVLRQILELRLEKARLLGYKNWADYMTEELMMKSGDNAAKFIERLHRVSQAKVKAEYQELLAFKRDQGDKRATRIEDYEKVFLENKLKEASYSFDSQTVRPYFAYRQVEDGLLAITARMYGIEYRPAKGLRLWHPDVRAMEVVRNGEVLGRIFLDMHPREGKYNHAAQFTLISGVVGAQLPEGVLVCNFPKPGENSPGLMEHDDVVTMFHEFGHLMHHVLGGQGQKWMQQSGTATEWDFVEAPSQMFEEWAWKHDSLATFARHYQTSEPIPEELVGRMQKAKKFGVGLTTAQQTFYAAISLYFHTADPRKFDMTAEIKRLQNSLTPFKFVEGTRFHASFGHLEGYSALYYTYMWSLVIAKDLFSPFEKHGLMDPEWNTRYRDRVLAPGGTKDAADLIKDFLGREWSYEAFERDLSQ